MGEAEAACALVMFWMWKPCAPLAALGAPCGRTSLCPERLRLLTSLLQGLGKNQRGDGVPVGGRQLPNQSPGCLQQRGFKGTAWATRAHSGLTWKFPSPGCPGTVAGVRERRGSHPAGPALFSITSPG